jgi:N-acetylmuramic acid 6-phosphate etherase
MLSGGRLFYIGAGTSGRLGVLDASECPPTFGVPAGLVTGIIAGGEQALTSAIEHAEDNAEQGWKDLLKHDISSRDVVIGLTAGGTTPYVLGALKSCREASITTGCITCNPQAPVTEWSDFPVEAITGPEFITGSTRLKAGTAQKLIINMISTVVMIKLGRVSDNKMVDLLLHNEKLQERGVRMVMEASGLTDPEKARELLLSEGSARKAIAAANAQKKGPNSQKKQ